MSSLTTVSGLAYRRRNMATRNEIKVKIDAKKLAIHTLKITQNLNNFPKKYRFTLVDKLTNCSLEIISNIEDANTHTGDERKLWQTMAISNCEKMKTYIEIVMDVLHPKCSISYWNDMVENIEQQLKKWRKSTK